MFFVEEWLIFPNPIGSTLTLNSRNYSGLLNVELISIQGQILVQEEVLFDNELCLETSSLDGGVYFFEITE